MFVSLLLAICPAMIRKETVAGLEIATVTLKLMLGHTVPFLVSLLLEICPNTTSKEKEKERKVIPDPIDDRKFQE